MVASLLENQGMLTAATRPMSILVGSCAVVATGAVLGMDWLREPVLGLPTGLWIIAIVQLQGWLVARSAGSVTMPAEENPRHESVPSAASQILGRTLGAGWECFRALAQSLRVPRTWFVSLEDRLSARADRLVSPTHTLRIGLDAGPEFRNAIINQATELDIEWLTLSPGADDQATLRRYRLDTLVRAGSGDPTRPIKIVTMEHAEREGGWYDWASARPLTYASVFPVRVDPSQITVESADYTKPEQAAILGALIRSSAALSRSPGRLRLSDRLSGRTPSTSREAGVRTPTSVLDRAMLELAGTVIDKGTTASPVSLAAARAVSAWLASTEAWLDINLRRKGVEAAAVLLPGESEVQLRAAAVRLAMFDDDVAFAAMLEAGKIIRSGSHEQIGEHLAFLQAELEMGSPNPLTLGRVAAGICLVCASTTPDRAAFIRGDLMDDVRHSAWLVGRDQDRAVLAEVFKLMGADQVQRGPWELRDAA